MSSVFLRGGPGGDRRLLPSDHFRTIEEEAPLQWTDSGSGYAVDAQRKGANELFLCFDLL